jgi:hypothetical protein
LQSPEKQSWNLFTIIATIVIMMYAFLAAAAHLRESVNKFHPYYCLSKKKKKNSMIVSPNRKYIGNEGVTPISTAQKQKLKNDCNALLLYLKKKI